MRPVEKKSPGDKVCYTNSNNERVTHLVKEFYPEYGNAKLPLTANIGQYCSYCEGYEKLPSLDIEHLAAKSKGGSRTAWNNFLLCCKICNSCKGTKEVDENYHWPHLNNTFYSFVYDETGRIKVNENMPDLSKHKAQNLLDLTQLQRYPGTDNKPSPKDYRWQYRFEAWNKAVRYRKLFVDRAINEDDIISYVQKTGQWSVWFTVFKGIDAVRARLISDFPGTCVACFDAHNHYEPLQRNPGQADPV